MLAGLLLCFSSLAQAVEDGVQSVTSRGLEQSFILTRPDSAPCAALVLMAGGHGRLQLGSFSAANAAIELDDRLAGVVLTSSVTQSKQSWSIYDSYPNGVINLPLERVRIPVLLVAHEDDQCALTPAPDIDRLGGRFNNAPRVAKALFSGGDAARSGPCNALSKHGFLGTERQVVERIADFIRAN